MNHFVKFQHCFFHSKKDNIMLAHYVTKNNVFMRIKTLAKFLINFFVYFVM